MGKRRFNQWQINESATDQRLQPSDPRDADVHDEKFSRSMEAYHKGDQPIAPKMLDPKSERARARELKRQAHVQRQRGHPHHMIGRKT